MKKIIVLPLLLAILLGGWAISCQKADPAPVTGTLQLSFDNVVGSQALTLNGPTYTNATGETFTVTKFNYFISNLRLKRTDGSEYIVPQDNSYFLVQEDLPASQTLTLDNVPTGGYTAVTFTIGVDSLRSTMDIAKRTGVLDPGLSGHDPMYWEWNSGYIFLKLEGTSPVAPAAQNRQFLYHIGGFGGGFDGKKTLNNLRTVTVSFNGDKANVTSTTSEQVNLTTDVLAIFNGPTPISIATNSAVMFEPYSANIAANYVQMIRYKSMNVN